MLAKFLITTLLSPLQSPPLTRIETLTIKPNSIVRMAVIVKASTEIRTWMLNPILTGGNPKGKSDLDNPIEH